MSKALVTLSRNAIQALKSISKQNGHQILQFSLKGGGCVGFKQELKPIKESDIQKFDEIINIPLSFNSSVNHSNLKIVIDKHAILKLAGTEIDYQESLIKSGFVFNNPNITAKCGCGESVGF